MQRQPPQPTSPSVRIQRPSPTPVSSSPSLPRPSMLAQSALVGGWNDGYNAGAYLSALPKTFQDQYHKRGSSGSSVTSAGPPSPLAQNTIYPHIVATSDSNYPSSYDFDYTQPTQTIKSESVMYPIHYGAVDMRRMQSQGGGDERASYNLSAPQSVSSMSHNSPATPHTTYETEFDEKTVYAYPHSQAYHQAMNEVFPDQQQYRNAMAFAQAQQNMAQLNVTPQRHNVMADRLQAANQDHLRTNSPTSNPRDKSPFRQNSPYMQAPAPALRQKPTLQSQRTSISPKELMLDEHDIDDNATPLFGTPDHSQSVFQTRRTQAPSNLSNFYTPSMIDQPNMQIPQQYPFVGQTVRADGLPDSTPEFPAHLISMESTADEGPSEPSSQQSMQQTRQQQSGGQTSPQRPVNTSSDQGTYSCTYHGCHLRFESPAKLQKHKREGHRQTSPHADQNADLALRNSQAGPHRCDRINPSTRKPCNSIFSRPYDLTRHEDTIHNARKLKVRCHLCTEEKTFSRNDALTRHMRVVHPDVDWVGKQKRKNAKALS